MRKFTASTQSKLPGKYMHRWLLHRISYCWDMHSEAGKHVSSLSFIVIVETFTKKLTHSFCATALKPEFTEGTRHSISMLFSPTHELWDSFICLTFSNPYDEYRMINHFRVLSMSEYKYLRNTITFSFKTLLAADWYDNLLCRSKLEKHCDYGQKHQLTLHV